jgi:hypothetical protein
VGDVIPQFFISYSYIMKLVKTLLADGRFKVVDADTKRVLAIAISADKVDKFISGARGLRTAHQKKADHERLVALTLGQSKTILRKKK